MRESAVIISSTIPSAKYSCSGSPLIFWNGSTAIDGLSGRGNGWGEAGAGALGRPARAHRPASLSCPAALHADLLVLAQPRSNCGSPGSDLLRSEEWGMDRSVAQATAISRAIQEDVAEVAVAVG